MTHTASSFSANQEGEHLPVLFDEVLSVFEEMDRKNLLICDATFGGGGHTSGFLDRLPHSRVVAFDQDPSAAPRAEAVEASYGERFRFIPENFESIPEDEELGKGFDGALFDLGVSSFQLDEGNRGFSFREDAAVDMRMDPRVGISAAEFLETADESELVEAVRDFGEEKRWRTVVAAIIQARGTGALQTTHRLAQLIEDTLGRAPAYLKGRKTLRRHPATLTFQGIRIAVNRELEVMERAVPATFKLLKAGGRLAVISFHSLEDRFIKRIFRQFAGRPEHKNDSRPAEERQIQGKLLTTKAIQASDAELARNPRSRSARLRLIEKL